MVGLNVGPININITTSTTIVFQDGEASEVEGFAGSDQGGSLSAVIIDDLPGLSAISSWILTSFSLRTTPPLFSLFFYPPNPHPSLECHLHPTPCFNVQRYNWPWAALLFPRTLGMRGSRWPRPSQ